MKYAHLTIRDNPARPNPRKLRTRPEHVSYIIDDPDDPGSIVCASGDKFTTEGSGQEVEDALEAIGDDVQKTMITQLQPMLIALTNGIAALVDKIEALTTRVETLESTDAASAGGSDG